MFKFSRTGGGTQDQKYTKVGWMNTLLAILRKWVFMALPYTFQDTCVHILLAKKYKWLNSNFGCRNIHGHMIFSSVSCDSDLSSFWWASNHVPSCKCSLQLNPTGLISFSSMGVFYSVTSAAVFGWKVTQATESRDWWWLLKTILLK